MHTIFMNSKNSKTSDLHSLYSILQKSLMKSDKCIALSNLSVCYKGKIWNCYIRTINLKY